MKLFLDTSSLLKLYHKEEGTEELEILFTSVPVTEVFLAEIAKVEFASAVEKKVRTKEITETEAQTLLMLFELDFTKYTFITTDSIVIEEARKLLVKYGKSGLRTLDSIQFAVAITLSGQADVFLTSDNVLKLLFEAEGLTIQVKKYV